MPRVRKKKLVWDAVQWQQGVEVEGLQCADGGNCEYHPVCDVKTPHVHNGRPTLGVKPGHWVMKDQDGDFLVVSDQQYRKEFEEDR